MRLPWLSTCLCLFLTLPSVFSAAEGDAKPDETSVLSAVDLKPTIVWQKSAAGQIPTYTQTYSDIHDKPTQTAVIVPAGPAIAAVPVTSVSFNIPLQDSPGSKESIGLQALCWYPVSGYYGRLARILFYCTMLFSIFARRHQWLIVGALAASMTYSGTAALHACILVWGNLGYGNNDIWAILGVLLFSSAMVIPLLTWSKTIKDIGKAREEDSIARSIILAWAFLIFIGFITIFVGIIGGRISNNIGEGHWHVISPVYTGSESFTCTPPENTLNLAAGQNANWTSMYITSEFVEVNGCNSPCREPKFASLLKPAESLKTLKRSEVEWWIEISDEGPKSKTTNFILYGLVFGGLALMWAILQALTIIRFGRRSPTQVRNKVYLGLYSLFMDHDGTDSDRKVSLHKVPHLAAKTGAYLFYAWGVGSSIVAVIIVVGSIVATELLMAGLPQSQEDYEIDSWAVWVATALLLLTAFLYRFEGIFEDYLMRFLNTIMEGLHMCFHGRGKEGCNSWKHEHDGEDTSNPSIVKDAIVESLQHYRERFGHWPKTMQESWADSKKFYGDAHDTASGNTGERSNRERKVVNIEGQKFPDQWIKDQKDDWMNIDDFVETCRKYDELRKADKKNNPHGTGYKWQPRVIPDDKWTAATRTPFNTELLKDIFRRHRAKAGGHDMEGGIEYIPVSTGAKDADKHDSDEEIEKTNRKDSAVVRTVPLGSGDYSIPPSDQLATIATEPIGSRRTSKVPHISQLSAGSIHPVCRVSSMPVSQYSALGTQPLAAGDIPAGVPAHIRHAATFQDRPKRRTMQQQMQQQHQHQSPPLQTGPTPTPREQKRASPQLRTLDLTSPPSRPIIEAIKSPPPPPAPTSRPAARMSGSVDKTLPELPAPVTESWALSLNDRDSLMGPAADAGSGPGKNANASANPNVSPMTRTASARSWVAGDDHA